ncbi:hypothetical protein BZA77DRAFT_356886 [Pyronema omphalodes]|nr:hypothetical protein BZA77DRAFT_357593 [Pyronema omphalodes]KAI5814348.1 hypothetical protein BZA77DRAFT_356886 [Pyronema omphalodes]
MYPFHPVHPPAPKPSVYTASSNGGYTADSGYMSNDSISEDNDYTSAPPSPSSPDWPSSDASALDPKPTEAGKSLFEHPLFPVDNPRSCFPLTEPWPYTYCTSCHNEFRMARKYHTAVSRSKLFWLAVDLEWLVTGTSGLLEAGGIAGPATIEDIMEDGAQDNSGKGNGKGKSKQTDQAEELGWVVYVYSCSPLGPYTNAVDLSIALTGNPDIQGIGIPKGAMWFKAAPEDREMRSRRKPEEQITMGKFTEWIRNGECKMRGRDW